MIEHGVLVDRGCTYLSFVPPCFCVYFRRSKGGRAPLFEEFLRMRSFNFLIFFLPCELRGDVELFWHPSFVVTDAPAVVMRSC